MGSHEKTAVRHWRQALSTGGEGRARAPHARMTGRGAGLFGGAGTRPERRKSTPVPRDVVLLSPLEKCSEKSNDYHRGRNAPKKEDIWTTADAIACVASVVWP